MQERHYDFIIIGGGVVGCALARELSRYRVKTALLEKESDLAEGISKANSGVLHGGFNVPPGTLKARFNVEGLRAYPALLTELGVEYRICRKLVVARRREEIPYLERLLDQGEKNRCTGLSLVGREEIRRLQPGVEGAAALYSESTGIVDPYRLTVALGENAAENGVEIFLNRRVDGMERHSGEYRLRCGSEIFSAPLVINAAGFGAEEVARLAGIDVPPVTPVRGEYYVLDRKGADRLSLAVYPVPPADGSGLGVHLTPTLNGNILFGPSADTVADGEDTATTRTVMDRLKAEAFELMPGLRDVEFIKNYAGNRPKLFTPGGEVSFADFYIAEDAPGLVNLLGIESPGLTSAPAMADYILHTLLARRWRRERKDSFQPRWGGPRRIARLSLEERRRLIAGNPDFGEVICRCEGITRGEMVHALANPLGVRTLNGIKKRTGAMTGRCQSGFCLSRIMEILREGGLSPGEVRRGGSRSRVVLGEREG